MTSAPPKWPHGSRYFDRFWSDAPSEPAAGQIGTNSFTICGKTGHGLFLSGSRCAVCHDERLAALEKRVEEQQEQLAAITSSVLRLEDPASAAKERGEASLLAKGGTSLDSYSLADLFEAIRHHIRMFPQVCPNIRGDVQDLVEMVEHEVMFAPPDAAPVAEGREEKRAAFALENAAASLMAEAEKMDRPDSGEFRPAGEPPAPRDDGPGERCETTELCLKGKDHSGRHAFVPPATAKQPEQTAPEARRWTLHWHDLDDDETQWWCSAQPPCETTGRTIEVIDAAYHDAAMEQAKGLLEAGKKIFDFSRMWTAIDWLAKRVAVYRWFKEFERALGGPR